MMYYSSFNRIRGISSILSSRFSFSGETLNDKVRSSPSSSLSIPMLIQLFHPSFIQEGLLPESSVCREGHLAPSCPPPGPFLKKAEARFIDALRVSGRRCRPRCKQSGIICSLMLRRVEPCVFIPI